LLGKIKSSICGFVKDRGNASLKRSALLWKTADSLLYKSAWSNYSSRATCDPRTEILRLASFLIMDCVAIGNPSGMGAKLRTVAASNNRDHAPQSFLLLLARATYTMVLFFTHIPFVVNHTINATPPERLQQLLCVCYS